jgi:hypothetical protein
MSALWSDDHNQVADKDKSPVVNPDNLVAFNLKGEAGAFRKGEAIHCEKGGMNLTYLICR